METHQLLPFGIKISDIDLRSLKYSDYRLIQDLLLKHFLIIIEDQELSAKDCISFCKEYGDPIKTDYFFTHEKYKEIIRVTNSNNEKQGGLFPSLPISWHTAAADRLAPMEQILFLYCKYSGDEVVTSFSNMNTVFESLSSEEIGILRRTSGYFGFRMEGENENIFTEIEKKYFKKRSYVEKPLIIKQPLTGRETIFLPLLNLLGVNNKDFEIKRDYFVTLIDQINDPRSVYHHRWKKKDVVICDQSMTLHKRTEVIAPRLLYRLIYSYKLNF